MKEIVKGESYVVLSQEEVEALRKAVPTFRKPEEANREADLKEKAEEKGNYKLKKSGCKIAAL